MLLYDHEIFFDILDTKKQKTKLLKENKTLLEELAGLLVCEYLLNPLHLL